MDIKLPQSNGFSICSEVRSFSNVPIIFVTSCDTDMDELNSIILGGDALTKPCNSAISTDKGKLLFADNACYEDAIGETVYNSYTDVLYVFPDSVCKSLLAVMRNRYIKTEAAIPYSDAASLETHFRNKYPERPDSGTGVAYYICLTVLSLKQLAVYLAPIQSA